MSGIYNYKEYIGRFNLVNKLVSNLKDIILEISDLGYDVNIGTSSKNKLADTIGIFIKGERISIDIEDSIFRIFDYIKMEVNNPIIDIKVSYLLGDIKIRSREEFDNLDDLISLLHSDDKEIKTISLFLIIPDIPIKESLIEEEPEVQEIRDILLELEDIGFSTKVTELPQFRRGSIKVKADIRDRRKGYQSLFRIEYISEPLMRIKDYLNSRGWIVEIYIPKEHHNNQMEKIRFINDVAYVVSDYNKKVDWSITWCEVLMEKSGWLSRWKQG